MKRSEALELIAASKGNGVSVATMRSVRPWHLAGGAEDRHIDCIGCMGGASGLGLGLALAQPERLVFILDGDGSLLMQLGALSSIAGAAPANLYHFVLVNRLYETSGNQPIPAADRVDFAALATGAGYAQADSFSEIATLRERLDGIVASPGPALIALEVEPEEIGESVPRRRPEDPAAHLRQELA